MSTFPALDTPLVEVDDSTSIRKALDVLFEHRILSLPVFDKFLHDYEGFFDVSDAFSVIMGVKKLKKRIPSSKLVEQVLDVHGVKVDLAKSETADGMDLPISIFLKESGNRRRAPWKPVKDTDSWEKVIKILAEKPEIHYSSTRRVPVVDDTGKVINIISQSAIVNKLYKQYMIDAAMVPRCFLLTPRLDGLGLIKNITTVSESSTVYQAFDALCVKNISVVPIVDDNFSPVGVISKKDLWFYDRLQKMEKDGEDPQNWKVMEYVAKAEELAASCDASRSKCITTSLDTPLASFITLLATRKTHRIFVIDDDKRLVGVVSVADVCRRLAEIM
mmetsp:Transcript_6379/g.7303  ORF Transcript_6379/g.7303 Transcript_6379/m.7303 type:complete len:332 (+) Transcript_6379:175-1170(+)|eukprot:CAMPEP_0184013314 /NCGR_PEP_ID=MMETSP0954-20121128/4941_1 /TAXON_ID=627963 /ORGANISM="Aplanochytrium sp, Strain PBS07" /LENGTH=331 /DNA_ID=CAMNT_0026293483 /DNA_START=121 /DNA_END=1116 /DNA_ORIENTATION=+